MYDNDGVRGLRVNNGAKLDHEHSHDAKSSLTDQVEANNYTKM